MSRRYRVRVNSAYCSRDLWFAFTPCSHLHSVKGEGNGQPIRPTVSDAIIRS